MKKKRLLFILVLCIGYITDISAQDRFRLLEEQLQTAALAVPALNNKPQVAISDVTLHGFLKSLAETNHLNLSVDPNLNQKIIANYSNETIINILLHLARQYNLDFRFTGTIISIIPFVEQQIIPPAPPPKEVKANFDNNSQTLTLDLQDDSLLNVARKITQLTNKNVVVLPELFGKRISGYIQNLGIANALEKLALSNSFKLNKTNDDVFVLQALAVNEQILPRQTGIPNANYSIQKINPEPNGGYTTSVSGSEEAGNRFVSFNIINTPLSQAVKQIADQHQVNYFIYTELVGNRTAKVDNMDFNDALSYLLQGTAYTFNISNGVYMIGNREDEGLRAHRLLQLKYRSVDSMLAVIPAHLRRGVEIKEFDELNSFIISGSQPQIIEIENFVKELDKTVPVITVELIIIDIQKRKTVSTGLTVGLSDSIQRGGTLLGGTSPSGLGTGTGFTFSSGDINRLIGLLGINNVFNIGRVSPNFYATLRALEANSDVEIRQTPKLSTINGHEAEYSTGSVRYYRNETENIGGALSPIRTITRQFEEVEAKLRIRIRPFVSGDEQITLNIEVENSDFIGELKPDEPPPKATSNFVSSIRVKNEEMILLGGIERNEKSNSGSGVPLLSRIPILKWIFSNRTKSTGRIVSIVFIKPSISY